MGPVAANGDADGHPFARSEHLLLTAAARAENTGMVFALGRTSALEAGGFRYEVTVGR